MRSDLVTRTFGHEDPRLVALTAVYLADRADHSASLTNAVAMLGAGVAYATGTLAFFDQISAALEPLVVAMLPFPLWMVVLYHALVVAAAMIRAASISSLERVILSNTGLPAPVLDRTGFRASHSIFNIAVASWPHRLASLITYAGTGLVAMAYTAYILTRKGLLSAPWLVALSIGYALLAGLWLTVWLNGSARYFESRRVLDAGAPPPGPSGEPPEGETT
jgi:hypothetical protein